MVLGSKGKKPREKIIEYGHFPSSNLPDICHHIYDKGSIFPMIIVVVLRLKVRLHFLNQVTFGWLCHHPVFIKQQRRGCNVIFQKVLRGDTSITSEFQCSTNNVNILDYSLSCILCFISDCIHCFQVHSIYAVGDPLSFGEESILSHTHVLFFSFGNSIQDVISDVC